MSLFICNPFSKNVVLYSSASSFRDNTVDDHVDSFAPISPLLPGVLLEQADRVSCEKLK